MIVSYNPDSNLTDLIQNILNQSSAVILVDNGSNKDNQAVLDQFFDHKHCHFIKLDSNYGLGRAQNIGIEKAKELNFENIIFFDQDSQIDDHFIQTMLNCYENCFNEKIGLLGSNYYDYKTGLYAKFAQLKTFGFKSVVFGKSAQSIHEDSSFALSSGSLIPVKIFNEVGNFRESFFIDNIDTEFCLRVQKYGYKVKICTNSFLKHSVGHRTVHRLFGLLTIKPNHHSAFRKYTITRNGIKTILDYLPYKPSFATLMLFRLFHDVLGIIFYENQKLKKLNAMLIGFLDSFKNSAKWEMKFKD